MSFQVPCPVGSFEVGRGGQAALQLMSQATRSLSSGRGVPVGRFVGRPKIRIPDTALGGKNECSVEIALSGKSPQTLNQGLSLALLWDMQRKWL